MTCEVSPVAMICHSKVFFGFVLGGNQGHNNEKMDLTDLPTFCLGQLRTVVLCNLIARLM